MQSPDMGGAETYMLSLIDSFQKRGHIVLVASNKEKFLTHAQKLVENTYEVPFILDIIGNWKGLVKSTLRLPYALYYYYRLLSRFKQNDVDVILMSGFSEKMLVTLLSPLFKLPVVWLEYGSLTTIFPRNFYLPKIAYWYCLRYVKHIIVPCLHTQKSLVKDIPQLKELLVMIPCGIVLHKQKTSQSIKKQYPNTLIIGCVSRLTREKGQDVLLGAVPQIIKEIPNALFLIIGEGPDKTYYQKLVKTLHIEKYVQILGFVKNLDEYYDAMDIFVFPTVWELEGFGLVIPEAMLHKIAVIGSNIGPVPETIDHGKTGIIVRPHDSNALAHAIVQLAKNAMLRIQYGEAGYKKVVELYDIEKVSAKILNILYNATRQ